VANVKASRRAPVKSKGPAPARQGRAAGPAGLGIPDKTLSIPDGLAVRQLADLLGMTPVEVIKALIKHGFMATVNQVIDYKTAATAAEELGFQPEPETAVAGPVRPGRPKLEEDAQDLQPRPPVITVMGHVDHGKTSLLDYVRRANVAAQEVGGITQHVGAYQAQVQGQLITFIDTPGHEAFTAMRARGAQVTDIALLVVAADDGVMPQTIEAINHARAAEVPIVVAINKADLPDADLERVKRQISEQGLIIEEWGGETICMPVSAKTGEGVQGLLENILVLAELLDLKANPGRPAVGAVIEASLDSSRGPMATILVQAGTLRVGDLILVGATCGRVKAMFDHLGARMREAGPSTPAQVMGLAAVPAAGEIVTIEGNERAARELIEERQRAKVRQTLAPQAAHVGPGGKALRELNIVLKTDVQGTVEAVRTSLERLSTDEVKVRVLHTAPGNITESDVMLASASRAVIIGFNARPDPAARRMADGEGVEIRLYNIIYRLLEEIEAVVKGLTAPTLVEVEEGQAEVLQVFRVGRNQAAGCNVREGVLRRGALIRVKRGEELLYEGRLDSLRRFKEDVREVTAGYECGIGLPGFDDFQPGDTVETYRQQRQH